jgi:hypothetical protein
MGNLGLIDNRRTFALNDAQAVIPLIYKITYESQSELRILLNKKKALGNSSDIETEEKLELCDKEIEQIVYRWEQKILRLGALPKGLWIADFDKGDGFFCWKYPEIKITHWHGYTEGFSSRKEVTSENSHFTFAP